MFNVEAQNKNPSLDIGFSTLKPKVKIISKHAQKQFTPVSSSLEEESPMQKETTFIKMVS